MRRLGLTAALLVVAAAAPASAGAASLYDGPGPRPGPDALYADAPRAPQLENTGIWKAAPILISGASAYRDGEFLYQDYIYDDRGAASVPDPGAPLGTGSAFAKPTGTYTYPSDRVYEHNAADIVELRVRRLEDATAFRLTLNTLRDPEVVGATIALGTGEERALPHGAGVRAPARIFLTWHGTVAELRDAATNAVRTPAPGVSVDRERRQVEIRVPHAAWDPGRGTVRMSAGVGLWDKGAGSYVAPGASASATKPGGGGLGAPAIVNAAFRYDEELPDIHDPVTTVASAAFWRERTQAAALSAGDLGRFHAEVDFGKLADGTDDDMTGRPGGVPASGPMDRIFASRFNDSQGVHPEGGCGEAGPCNGELQGQLQPYAIYVPAKPAPESGFGLTLLLHSLDANYNQFLGSRNQSQFGDRGAGSIVATASGRGSDGWYYDRAEGDTFEMWADVARHYKLDPAWTAIAGYSMGGYATYKLAARYPDLFARAQPTVGPPALGVGPGDAGSDTGPMLASLRNVPFKIWDGVADELVPVGFVLQHIAKFDALGYRYSFELFPAADHFALAVNDQYQTAADFLGTAKVDRDPAHVTYVLNPSMDFPDSDVVADHAYWLSGMRLWDTTGGTPLGKIDAVSEAMGKGDPEPGQTTRGTGALPPGTFGAMPYSVQARTWGEAPDVPRRDRLRIKAENVSQVTVNAPRAGLSCGAEVAVESDVPIDVKLTGCGAARCVDVTRPRATVRSATVRRRKGVRISGRATDKGCTGQKEGVESRAGHVSRVEVAVSRRARGRCRYLRSNGRLTKARSCSRRVWVRARGASTWSVKTRRRLPAGRYTIVVRAVDRVGNRQLHASRRIRRAR